MTSEPDPLGGLCQRVDALPDLALADLIAEAGQATDRSDKADETYACHPE